MLLYEIIQPLFEALNLESPYPLWIQPSSGKSIGHGEATASSHAWIIGLYAQEMGLPQDLVDSIPEIDSESFDDASFIEWANVNDRLYSPFHLAAYEQGWVRYYFDKALLELYVSGRQADIRKLISNQEFTQAVKTLLSQHPDGGATLTADVMDAPPQAGSHPNLKHHSIDQTVMNLIDLNKFRRSVG